jgi:hypothetical protein
MLKFFLHPLQVTTVVPLLVLGLYVPVLPHLGQLSIVGPGMLAILYSSNIDVLRT